MPTVSLQDHLRERSYPGRGLAVARLADGSRCIAYFLTGRSTASRQRQVVVLPGGDVQVRATDPAAADDPLRHYVAVACRGGTLVVGNGDQVAPVAEALAAGADPMAAFAAHDYEPDSPIFTPRIWVVTGLSDEAPLLLCAAIRSVLPSASTDHAVWKPGPLSAGEGALLTTYSGTAAAVSTSTEPVAFTTGAPDGAALIDELWASLDPDLRVAAVALRPGSFPAGVLTHGQASP